MLPEEKTEIVQAKLSEKIEKLTISKGGRLNPSHHLPDHIGVWCHVIIPTDRIFINVMVIITVFGDNSHDEQKEHVQNSTQKMADILSIMG